MGRNISCLFRVLRANIYCKQENINISNKKGCQRHQIVSNKRRPWHTNIIDGSENTTSNPKSIMRTIFLRVVRRRPLNAGDFAQSGRLNMREFNLIKTFSSPGKRRERTFWVIRNNWWYRSHFCQRHKQRAFWIR